MTAPPEITSVARIMRFGPRPRHRRDVRSRSAIDELAAAAFEPYAVA